MAQQSKVWIRDMNSESVWQLSCGHIIHTFIRINLIHTWWNKCLETLTSTALSTSSSK